MCTNYMQVIVIFNLAILFHAINWTMVNCFDESNLWILFQKGQAQKNSGMQSVNFNQSHIL